MTQTAIPTHDLTDVGSQMQLAALLQGTGYHRLVETGWIRVTGEDRVRWLNGMVTNSVQELQPGQGCYNFLLNVQGRIQGDATIYAEPSALLLETALDAVSGMISLLDRFIIMDDVELADISGEQVGLSLAGPGAEASLSGIGLPAAGLQQLSFQKMTWRNGNVRLIHGYSPLVPQFEIWGDGATLEALTAALKANGAVNCGAESIEWLRILSGIPRIGTDIGDRDLPQETGQTRALHFAKGCYLGQEIVERIRSRGNVHRTFSAFRLDGLLPSPGAPLEVDAKPVGELTSVVEIPLASSAGALRLALGYLRREALERKSLLLYPGGTAQPVETPYSLAAAAASYPPERT